MRPMVGVAGKEFYIELQFEDDGPWYSVPLSRKDILEVFQSAKNFLTEQNIELKNLTSSRFDCRYVNRAGHILIGVVVRRY